MKFKPKLEDYTEVEFFASISEFFSSKSNLTDEEYGDYKEELLEHFITIVEHPHGSDLIYYPADGVEDSPEGVMQSVKKWLAQDNKPGFKSD